MKRRTVLEGLAASMLSMPAVAQSRQVVLTITHGFGGHHAPMVAEITRRFMLQHPDIEVRISMTADNWDPLLQTTLRNGLVGDLPDISHQSFNYARILNDRGFAQPLDELLGGEDRKSVV